MKKLSEREVYERSILEEDVLGSIRAMLEVNGARVHRVVERIPWGRSKYAKRSETGIPDLFGWFVRPTKEHPGRAFPLNFFIEVKRKGEKPTLAQIAWLAQADGDGVIAFWADSWETVKQELHKRGIKLAIE